MKAKTKKTLKTAAVVGGIAVVAGIAYLYWTGSQVTIHEDPMVSDGMMYPTPVGPGQARRGGRVRVLVPGRLACPVCGGTGGIGFFACWRCRGRGAVTGEFPVEVSFPPGLRGDRTAQVPLDHLGIEDVALVVHLRPTARD